MFRIEQHARVHGHTVNTLLPTVPEDSSARRWREWQLKREHHERRGTRRANLVFTVLFIGAGLWLGLQVFNRWVG